MARFFELFAGVGLVREALVPLGWECVYANDFDVSKQAIYAAKFPDHDGFDGRDIWKVEAAELPRPVDLIAASFPCIDLSLAGKREGLTGRHSGAFWAFVRILEQLREDGSLPRALMIENVTGFLSSNDGQDLHTAIRALNDLGFTVDVVRVTAEHFTPQSRPRIFVLAIRDDLAEDAMTVSGSETSYAWARAVTANPAIRPRKIQDLMLFDTSNAYQGSLLKKKTGGLRFGVIDFPELPEREQSLVDIVDWREDLWWSTERTNKALREMNPLHEQRIRLMIEAGGRRVATAYRRRRNGKSVYEVRGDGVAGCLRTARGGSSTQIVLVAERGAVRMRWMTPREYARLQGSDLPEELLVFSDAALRTAFGDAVCVPAVRWVAENALASILRTPRRSQPHQQAMSLGDLKGSSPTTREYPGKEGEREAARESTVCNYLGGS